MAETGWQVDDPRAGATTVVDDLPRCWHCGKVLFAYAGRPWSIRCRECRAPNVSSPDAPATAYTPNPIPHSARTGRVWKETPRG